MNDFHLQNANTNDTNRYRVDRQKTMKRVASSMRAAFIIGTALSLGGCQSAGSDPDLTSHNPTAPAVLPIEEINCPPFDVVEKAAAIRVGEGRELRYQIAIGSTARECRIRTNGHHTVNVGVEVLALLGPAGKAGTYSAPLHISIKQEGKILVTRTRQLSMTIPPGKAQAVAQIIEEDLPLPKKNEGYDTSGVVIEIGLGSTKR